MRKEDLDWGIYDNIRDVSREEAHRRVEICGTTYHVSENTACLCHAVMLLVDSLNDKKNL